MIASWPRGAKSSSLPVLTELFPGSNSSPNGEVPFRREGLSSNRRVLLNYRDSSPTVEFFLPTGLLATATGETSGTVFSGNGGCKSRHDLCSSPTRPVFLSVNDTPRTQADLFFQHKDKENMIPA